VVAALLPAEEPDALSFAEGYITIVPIAADSTARSFRGLEWLRLDASYANESKRATAG